MRKFLYAFTFVALITVGLFAQSSGGSFVPSFSYVFSGDNVFSGANTFSGANAFSGVATMTSPVLTAPVLNAPTTTTNLGAKNGSTVSVVEKGDGVLHQTVITLTALPLTLADATVGAGVKIYDFPEGAITIVGSTGSVAETTTAIILNTLNGGVTYNWGVGTTTQANGTLATTEQDVIPTTNGTSSATINVAAAASGGVRTAAPANFDGTGTAKDAFFNVGIAGATDIDADATTTWTGTITITWYFNGDK